MIAFLRRIFLIFYLGLFLGNFCSVLSYSANNTSVSYRIVGVVATVDSSQKNVLLKHEIVQGFLDAGETLFSVSKGDSLLMQAGITVRGKAYFSNERYYLEQVYPVDPKTEKIMAEINRRLRLDTLLRGRKVLRGVGETAPSFAFYNQNGEMIRLDLLKGKTVVLNFIFTRCLDPEMCPATTRKMADLQLLAQEKAIKDLHFILVSFDPEYDSPGVLKDYGSIYGIDNNNFDLLTGERDAINDAMKQFGIIHVLEDGTIKHTMATLLINKNGRIAYRKEGRSWNVNELLEKIQNLDKVVTVDQQ